LAAEVDQRPQYGHPDARTGLGYGQVQQTGRNAPRSAQGQFPYFEPPTDDHEGMDEEEMDSELVAAVVARILGDVQVTDPYAASGTDPFYYVAGNTKLSEDSNRMHPVGNSMAPFPRMYQGAVYANPGSPLRYYGPTDSFNSTSQPTGSKDGNSRGMPFIPGSRPPVYVHDVDEIEDDERADQDAVDTIRAYTREILRQNLG